MFSPAAVTKYHRLDVSASRYLSLQAQRLRLKLPAAPESVPAGGPLPCLQTAASLLHFYTVGVGGEVEREKETRETERKREKGKMSTLHFFLEKCWSHERAPLRTSSIPSYCPRFHLQIPSDQR